MFPVNPNYKSDREMDDQGQIKEQRDLLSFSHFNILEIESIMSSNLSRKSSLKETRFSFDSHSQEAPYEDLLSVTTIKNSSLVIGVVGKALSIDKDRKT